MDSCLGLVIGLLFAHFDLLFGWGLLVSYASAGLLSLFVGFGFCWVVLDLLVPRWVGVGFI